LKLKVTLFDESGEVDENLPETFQGIDHQIGLVQELEVNPGSEIGIELINYQPPADGSQCLINVRVRNLPFLLTTK